MREQIDTTTPGGKLVFHLFGALAEFEREVSANGRRPGCRVPGYEAAPEANRAAWIRSRWRWLRRCWPIRTATWWTFAARWGLSRSTLYRLNSGTRQNNPPTPKMHLPDPKPPSQSKPQETPAPEQPESKLSPGTKAFIRQLAENLNTHDPDKPKGRLKKPQGFSGQGQGHGRACAAAECVSGPPRAGTSRRRGCVAARQAWERCLACAPSYRRGQTAPFTRRAAAGRPPAHAARRARLVDPPRAAGPQRGFPFLA